MCDSKGFVERDTFIIKFSHRSPYSRSYWKIDSEREKIVLSGVIKKYRDLKKYVKDLESQIFGKELEDSLKNPKDTHYSLEVYWYIKIRRASQKDPWLATGAFLKTNF